MKGTSISLGPVLLSHAAAVLGVTAFQSPKMLITNTVGQEDDYSTYMVTDYTNVTTFETVTVTASTAPASIMPTITTLTEPPSTTAAPTSSFTGYCDYRYCEDGKSICVYWAGYTSWDVSLGPMPGEIPTILGAC